MSHRPVTPNRASRSSSSSGMASSDRISRPYHVESWSSHTWLDFAMSTRRGIHASSLEKRSGSSPRAEKSLISGRPPASPKPPPNRWWSPRSSSLITSTVIRSCPSSPVSRSPRSVPQRSRIQRNCPESEVGWARAGARRSSTSVSPSSPRTGPSAASASSVAMARSRASGATRPSSTSSRSGPRAGFSLVTRRSSSSSRRSGRSRASSSGNSAATALSSVS